jgi:glutamate dehydrogenase (NADP+)
MSELYRHIGADTDVPAGDIGVGAREIGFLFGQYKKLRNEFAGVLTGKGPEWGGSQARTEATGYGLVYLAAELLQKLRGDDLKGKTAVVSGSGNVAIFAAEKLQTLGARVVAMSDSSGYIYDANGVDLDLIKELKLAQRARISEYIKTRPNAKFVAGGKVWAVKCDAAFPCATQNELDENDARELIKNGVQIVAEGANMPSTPAAIEILQTAGVIFAPAKAANAGGVAVSGLEMAQDSSRTRWTFAEVDDELRAIMSDIVAEILAAAREYNLGDDLVAGANIAGFTRVAGAMLAQGIV